MPQSVFVICRFGTTEIVYPLPRWMLKVQKTVNKNIQVLSFFAELDKAKTLGAHGTIGNIEQQVDYIDSDQYDISKCLLSDFCLFFFLPRSARADMT